MTETSRFTDNNDGTISDHQTGLIWAREDTWLSEGRWVSWDEAESYTKDFNRNKFAGSREWRLPSEKEALSLCTGEKLNKDKYGNEIQLDPVFPEGCLAKIWTSESLGNDAVMVDLGTGEKRELYKSKSGRMAARAVRDAEQEE